MRAVGRLVVGDVSLRAIGALRPLVAGIRRRDRDLSEQLARAMTSVARSIARAQVPSDGTRRRHLFVALASTGETQAVLRVALDCGYCSEAGAKAARALLDETHAMLCELARQR